MITKAKLQLFLLGIPQRRISEDLEVSPAYVSCCLNGQKKPSKRLIEAVVKLTGLPADALFEVNDG